MFRKKSLKVKLSLILIGIVLLISVSSVLLSNIFLKRFYLAKKNQTLISTFEKIDDMYAAELQGKTTESGENSSTDESLGSYAIPDSGISDELCLQLDKLSQTRNLSVIIYRDMSSPIFDYMLKSNTKLLLYSSLGMNQNSKVESSNIYSDYINADKSGDAASVKTDSYEIEKVNVKRLGASYIYLAGTFKNGDHILIRASFSSITESAALSNQFFLYISLVAALIGFVVMYFVSNRFLGPITVLTNIAKRMSELDFTAKYEVKTEDEVGVLGNSMNMLSETLEQALAELKEANTELKKDLEKKEQIDAMRKEFLSNVSHELKTPIALIQGYAEGLMDNINDDEESKEFYCEVIVDEARKMNQMVKKIMDLNQLEFGYNTLTMEHFDIIAMIRAVIAKSDILLKQKEINLAFDEDAPIYVWSDAYMSEEVFTNYLTNAINHADGEKRIDIQLEKKEKTVKITVHNTGEQIPEEDLSKLWDKFYKVDKARTREYGGSGVGLSIRYHDGEFRIYWGDPDRGFFMVKAKDPEGEWSKPVCVKEIKGLIDCCPFWDDNGDVYLSHGYAGSRAGVKSILGLLQMNKEGDATVGDTRIIYDGHTSQPTIEGTKMYKRNGYYYIFAPASIIFFKFTIKPTCIEFGCKRYFSMDGNSSLRAIFLCFLIISYRSL